MIEPLTAGQKFKLAFDDSFDPSAFLVAGFFGGISMAQNQYPPFGQGATGFGKYYGGAFADLVVGNMMTEAILPTALHQDPRYFIQGEGGFWKRTGHAMRWTLVTRNDGGGSSWNASEILGNGIAAGISNVYYPAEDRTAGKTMSKWGQQVGVDAVFNVMKEFWPDVRSEALSPRTGMMRQFLVLPAAASADLGPEPCPICRASTIVTEGRGN